MRKIIFLLAICFCFSAIVEAATTRRIWNFGMPYGGVASQLTLIDPAAASQTAFKNTTISTATLVAGATTFVLANADFTDTIHLRNATALINFATGIATTSVTGTLSITGTDHKGDPATETFLVSTNPVTGSVAWRSMTSMTLTITSIVDASTDAQVQVGSGVKMGLAKDVIGSAYINKVIEAGALTTTYTLNTTYDTITFVNAPDGSKDYQVYFYGYE